jgi:glycerol-3-phosphate dehydrogenase
LVEPLPIAIPTYGHGRQGKAFLGTGMLLYDLLTLDRNLSIGDPERRIPLSRFMNASRVMELFPGLNDDALTGAAVFWDGQMYNPTRLVLAIIRAAVDAGAVAVNYAEAEQLIYSDDTVIGARIRDSLTGERTEARARVVLNAAGPWVPWMMAEREKKPLATAGSYSRDACFVVKRRFSHPYAVAVQGATHDPDALLGRSARHLFVVPWRDYSLVGVWHRVWAEHPDQVRLGEDEIQSYIAEINNAWPGLSLELRDVTMWNTGLLPFGDNEPGAEHLSYGKRSHIIDHEREQGLSNLVSLIGVRYTMARGDAASAVDMVCGKLRKRRTRAPTHTVPVDGGDFRSFAGLLEDVTRSAPPNLGEEVAASVAHNYGTRYVEIFSLAQTTPGWADRLGDSTTIKAEVVHAIRQEMAVCLSDIVFRRTDLASGGDPGERALADAAELAAQELGWDSGRKADELEQVKKRFVPGNRLTPRM